MVELIFVIVIIGVLASIGIPKLSGVSDGAKKTAEIATISAVSTAIESAHGEWSINENAFTWGNGITYSSTNPTLNGFGYPNDLNKTTYNVSSKTAQPFDAILKGDNSSFKREVAPTPSCSNRCIFSIFTGPASDPEKGIKLASPDVPNKPDRNDFWLYTSEVNCTNGLNYGEKTFYSGDIQLIDDLPRPTTLTCNP